LISTGFPEYAPILRLRSGCGEEAMSMALAKPRRPGTAG
jgi:hypothetical protein